MIKSPQKDYMSTRKQLKQFGRTSFKKHYILFVGVCLIAAFISAEFRGSLGFSEAQTYGTSTEEGAISSEDITIKTQINTISLTELLDVIINENIQQGQQLTDAFTQNEILAAADNQILGRSRGVLANLVNEVTSGSILVTLIMAASSITGSDGIGILILVVIGTIALFSFWFLVQNLFPVIVRRIFLEGMIYPRVTPQRFVFLLRIKRWSKAAWIMFVKYVFYTLWSLTLIGMVVKRYSYYLVPYIVAENPDMTARQAITLSRTMMRGHKWQCFLFELSFVGWHLLGFVTLGVVDLLYTNPYKTAAFTAYYAHLRSQAIQQQLPGTELLWDTYLYEKADRIELDARYADVIRVMEAPNGSPENLSGWRGFLANHFGILLFPREQERIYEKHRADLIQIKSMMDDVRGEAYPARLYPIPEEERRKLVQSINYMRHYSLWSLAAIFLGIAMLGWLWEVGLHLVTYGQFVNRGILHGPWLPIYGVGSILILTLLYRFRSNPALEFGTAIVLCGFLEYMASLLMELANDGAKWWDYTGYFLNLHGRICAEGLLLFGVGGICIVYLIAPILDDLLHHMDKKCSKIVCAVLMVLFLTDAVYSQVSPNMGEGVTTITQTSSAESE